MLTISTLVSVLRIIYTFNNVSTGLLVLQKAVCGTYLTVTIKDTGPIAETCTSHSETTTSSTKNKLARGKTVWAT